MIAPLIFYTPSLDLLFVLHFLRDKLTLLLLTYCLSSSQLHLLLQTNLFLLTLTSAVWFLLLELGGDEVHM